MKRIIFEDVHELSAEMLHDALNFSDCVSAVCHYELATTLLSELIQSEVQIGQIDLTNEWTGYDKEYFVYIVDGCVSCEPAFRSVNDGGHDKYLEMAADIMYVHQDCNSKVLKYIDCDKIFEFAVEELDGIDEDEMCCSGCADCEDTDDDIITHHSDSVIVSRNKFGTPTGFTKSWFKDNGDGISQYSSYSYYCNDEDILRGLAQDLGVEL